MHAQEYLINDVLKGELGFDGIVISDYDAIHQIDGDDETFTSAEVRASVNAGIDMIMLSRGHEKFLRSLRAEVEAGRVPMRRIDDATRRIPTKKFELGLFERPFAQRDLLFTVGSPEHRELARQAVRQSQVLLENDGVLPLSPDDGEKLFVAGSNADDIGNQSGGWTISWQGSGGAITEGTTILEGIRRASESPVTYDRRGNGIDGSYDAAVAVVGEKPYAEYRGDRPGDLEISQRDLDTIERLRSAGVPVIVVLVSGRPMDVADRVDDWNALLASWIPGTQGGGVTDVLFGEHDPTGKLPVTWMRSFEQQPINGGDGRKPLYPRGYGLSYSRCSESQGAPVRLRQPKPHRKVPPGSTTPERGDPHRCEAGRADFERTNSETTNASTPIPPATMKAVRRPVASGVPAGSVLPSEATVMNTAVPNAPATCWRVDRIALPWE